MQSIRFTIRSLALSFVVLFCSTTIGTAEEALSIGALGELRPQSGLVRLVGTPGISTLEINVKQNDRVTAGTVLARLSNFEMLRLELVSVKLEHEELISNHEHNLILQELAAENARLGLSRSNKSLKQYLGLSKNAQVNTVREVRRNAVADARYVFNLKKAELAKTTAMFELSKSKLNLQIKKAELNFASTEIRAPFDGVIVDVPGRVGAANSKGVVVIADLSKMLVRCEVYEGDLGKVKVNQMATISGKSLAEDLTGKVYSIGREIDVARKVATVWIELDDSTIASDFIGMEVSVSIKP